MIDKKVLKMVQADYDPTTGDTLIVTYGVKKTFASVYPNNHKEYAAGTNWFMSGEKISGKGKTYIKYGLPRLLGTNEVERLTDYKGVGVYVEAGQKGRPEVIYIPVRLGCEFQPYQIEAIKR